MKINTYDEWLEEKIADAIANKTRFEDYIEVPCDCDCPYCEVMVEEGPIVEFAHKLNRDDLAKRFEIDDYRKEIILDALKFDRWMGWLSGKTLIAGGLSPFSQISNRQLSFSLPEDMGIE